MTREDMIDEAVRRVVSEHHLYLPGCARVANGELAWWLKRYDWDWRIRTEFRRLEQENA